VGVRILIFFFFFFRPCSFGSLGLESPGNEGEEGACKEGLTDEVASGLGGLTTVSAPDNMSWLGVGGQPAHLPLLVPACARATRSFSSLLSVTLSMMELPPLQSGVPTAGAGSALGGGNLWLPSADSHALRDTHGKLRPMQLVWSGVDDKICFGLIGTKQFCRSEFCKVKAHKNKNNKFAMGTKGGWFLVVKSNLMSQPSAFIWPFLDAFKLTEDVTLTLKNASMDRQTMAEWEEFIFEAQEEWEEVEAHTLENIQEVGDDNVDDASNDQVEGDLVLSSPPSAFMWQEELDDVESAIKAKLDDMNPKNAKEAVEELQAAFGDLEGMVVKARQGSRNDAMEVLIHVDTSVTEIVAAIDWINKQGRQWESEVGDVTVLRDDSGLPSLTIVDTVAKMASLTTS
jgi:hypothetical protein